MSCLGARALVLTSVVDKSVVVFSLQATLTLLCFQCQQRLNMRVQARPSNNTVTGHVIPRVSASTGAAGCSELCSSTAAAHGRVAVRFGQSAPTRCVAQRHMDTRVDWGDRSALDCGGM